jgi:hypothetical protein
MMLARRLNVNPHKRAKPPPHAGAKKSRARTSPA